MPEMIISWHFMVYYVCFEDPFFLWKLKQQTCRKDYEPLAQINNTIWSKNKRTTNKQR